MLRTVHAERSKQLYDNAASMHRWVMASMLLLNTGAIGLALSSEGATMGGTKEELVSWVIGAFLAIVSGSVRSDADEIDGHNWMYLAGRNFHDETQGEKADYDGDVKLVHRMRIVAVSFRWLSSVAFAAGLAFAAGWM